MNEQTSIRYPATWEANILSGSTMLMMIVSSVILAIFLKLSSVLIVGQILVFAPTLLWVAIRRFPLQATFRLYPISARTVRWSILIGLSSWPVANGMAALFEKPLSLIGPYPAIPLPTNWVESAVYAITIIVLAPLTEEPIYRGFILQAWLRRGTRAGIVLSGFLFGMVHSQIAPLVPLILVGIVFGILAYRSQSALSSIIAHASYNAVAFLFVFIPSLQSTRDIIYIMAGIISLPIAVIVLWMFLRQTPAPTIANPPQESTSWWGPVISLLVVLGLFGLMAILEIFMRLSPSIGN